MHKRLYALVFPQIPLILDPTKPQNNQCYICTHRFFDRVYSVYVCDPISIPRFQIRFLLTINKGYFVNSVLFPVVLGKFIVALECFIAISSTKELCVYLFNHVAVKVSQKIRPCYIAQWKKWLKSK